MMQNVRGRDCSLLDDQTILAFSFHWQDTVLLNSRQDLLGEGHALLGQVGRKRLIAHLLYEKHINAGYKRATFSIKCQNLSVVHKWILKIWNICHSNLLNACYDLSSCCLLSLKLQVHEHPLFFLLLWIWSWAVIQQDRKSGFGAHHSCCLF